ncbi:hypothetical protein D1224_00535 [Henriciella barbarensis]|uniref:DUF3089 domain-containing protein n=1 Tax=Henriciella barbarensis TaxID=86342 RepID=A0A399R4F1_9PROT|nr:hypothetical protein [Henriciella barbarensis]RIJ26140.1 hypothetical protein D1224_00535 [Henriciella barbarensis]
MRPILIALGIVAALAVGWVAFKDGIYASWLGQGEREAVEPDYALEDDWLERPAEAPPGGWASPWGIDVVILAPFPTTPQPAGLLTASSDVIKNDFDGFMDEAGLSSELSSVVYAPSYRAPSPALGKRMRDEASALAAADVAAAVSRYASADNRKRGVLIVAAPGTEALLEGALSALPADEDFRQRFGGVMLPADMDVAEWMEVAGPCSDGVDACVVSTGLDASKPFRRFLLPSLPRPRLVYSDDGTLANTIDERADTLSVWLEENLPKPAEPFDTWAAEEVVDVAPIRRPNSERDISGERGN